MSRFQLLSDAQWSLIEEMLPRPTGRPGRRFSDARTMVEGIVYRYRTGIAWRDLPEVFGPWQTVWTWHRRMAFDGTWDRVAAKVTAAADAAGMMEHHRIHFLLVVNSEGGLCGALNTHDLMRAKVI